jgi:hypothetical protein
MQTGLLTPKGMTSQVRGVNVAIHNTHEASPTAQRPEELLGKKPAAKKKFLFIGFKA